MAELLKCALMWNLTPATGFDGEQALAVQLLHFGRRRRQIITGEPLPLSHMSYLSWLGFTAEGECPRKHVEFALNHILAFFLHISRHKQSNHILMGFFLRHPLLCGFRRGGEDAEPLPGKHMGTSV